MSIKKLFDSNKPQTVLVSTNLEEEVVKNAPELESADNVREQIKRINTFQRLISLIQQTSSLMALHSLITKTLFHASIVSSLMTALKRK